MHVRFREQNTWRTQRSISRWVPHRDESLLCNHDCTRGFGCAILRIIIYQEGGAIIMMSSIAVFGKVLWSYWTHYFCWSCSCTLCVWELGRTFFHRALNHLPTASHQCHVTGYQNGLRWNQEATGALGSHFLPQGILLCLSNYSVTYRVLVMTRPSV